LNRESIKKGITSWLLLAGSAKRAIVAGHFPVFLQQESSELWVFFGCVCENNTEVKQNN
jgi:hypothetical protein